MPAGWLSLFRKRSDEGRSEWWKGLRSGQRRRRSQRPSEGLIPCYAGSVNNREFRRHLAELLATQRNPDQASKKIVPTPEPPPKPATMSNKEFRRHIAQLLARQRNQVQPPVVKKPPKSEPSKPAAVKKKPPAAETRKFNHAEK